MTEEMTEETGGMIEGEVETGAVEEEEDSVMPGCRLLKLKITTGDRKPETG